MKPLEIGIRVLGYGIIQELDEESKSILEPFARDDFAVLSNLAIVMEFARPDAIIVRNYPVNQILMRIERTFWFVAQNFPDHCGQTLEQLRLHKQAITTHILGLPKPSFAYFQKLMLEELEKRKETRAQTTVEDLMSTQTDSVISMLSEKDIEEAQLDQAEKQFLAGEMVNAVLFESLLKRHCLWSGIPNATKGFITSKLWSVSSTSASCVHGRSPAVAVAARKLLDALTCIR